MLVRLHLGHLGSRIECAAGERDGSGESGAVARMASRARALGWSPALHSVSNNVPRLLEEFRRAQERAA